MAIDYISMRDIRSVDLNLLRTLDALLDERSVTKAAERLSLTQPAVSGMLTRLRESFDDPLFVRTQRGIVPTLRATQLAGPLKQILSDVETLLQPTAFEPSTAAFTLTLAATDYALQAAVVPFLAKLRRLAPSIRVATRPVEDDRVQAQFERGDLDLALMTPEATLPDLHARHLFDESYVCALRVDHPDASAGTLSIDRFCALDHALVSYAGQRFWGVTDDALTKIGRQRRVALSITSFMVLAEILRTTDLIAVVPRRLVAGAEGLVTFEPPVEIPGFTKLAVWHERTHRDAGHQWVRALLLETCNAVDADPEQLLGCSRDRVPAE
ncbi:LysR family transcriptional regulator [Bradyrhizobium sp. WYCCWR 12677]|uniref:LysR family transcriptional regulator n=1 Tax=unclassified Bradyrhizobium TaxID=2631580 RepID=UPI00263ABC9F|nr:LysR family transcriptional regulator [Bradyrhizobium sp. WYCCWR 12677]MDN5005461.1 LysR family transcriptional regulator [Bradyrhizobium sp. WYCCWR 12677]